MVDFPENSSTLYDRLGGRVTIYLAMEKFCDRLYDDPDLASLTKLMSAEDFKNVLAAESSKLLEDPKQYHAAMAERSDSLPRMTKDQFNRCISHLIAALVWASVSRHDIEEVLDAVTPLSDYFVQPEDESQ